MTNYSLRIFQLIGLLTKPFALSVRLLANMNAGHIIIMAFLGIIINMKSWKTINVTKKTMIENLKISFFVPKPTDNFFYIIVR